MTIPAWKQRQIDAAADARKRKAHGRAALVFDLTPDADEDAQLVLCQTCKAFKPQREFPTANRARVVWRCWRCTTCEGVQ